jgi:hypothetical protein
MVFTTPRDAAAQRAAASDGGAKRDAPGADSPADAIAALDVEAAPANGAHQPVRARERAAALWRKREAAASQTRRSLWRRRAAPPRLAGHCARRVAVMPRWRSALACDTGADTLRRGRFPSMRP